MCGCLVGCLAEGVMHPKKRRFFISRILRTSRISPSTVQFLLLECHRCYLESTRSQHSKIEIILILGTIQGYVGALHHLLLVMSKSMFALKRILQM